MFSLLKSNKLLIMVLASLCIWLLNKESNVSPTSGEELTPQTSKKPTHLPNQQAESKHDNASMELPATLPMIEVIPEELAILEREPRFNQHSTESEEPALGDPERPFDIQTTAELPASIPSVEVIPEELAILEQEANYDQPIPVAEEPIPGSPELPFDIQLEDELPASPPSVEAVPRELEILEQ